MMSIPLQVRAQAVALRAAFALPRPLRRLLAGPLVRRDGQELALDAQLLLRLMRIAGTRIVVDGNVDASRAGLDLSRHLVSGPVIGPVATQEIRIAVEHGRLAATLYTPEGLATPSGLLVFYHGGGWVIGSRLSHDNTARFLAQQAGVRVLSVEYRQPPEHIFPAAVEDALAAFDHAHDHAVDLGADPARIAVGGDSAGGNIAAVTAQLATRRGGPAPAFQLLLYPATDVSRRSHSRDSFADGFFLTGKDMDWFADHYAPAGVDRADPRMSPLLTDDLSGLPSAYIGTAGFDPLRDDGEDYAEALTKAGVPTTLSRQPDLIHGYANFLGIGHRFREATLEAAKALRTALSE
ncbi:alpha/beta hydrolase [Streptomyces echinatus]|uniref:alpha/beta hydrolase n=1 Tax=Streptomyces echinatus TaxID=67293 RepID=UPI0037BD9F98